MRLHMISRYDERSGLEALFLGHTRILERAGGAEKD